MRSEILWMSTLILIINMGLMSSKPIGVDEHDKSMELVMVTALFRHGTRAPDMDFEDNLYKPDYWKNGLNELTDYGIQQQKELGAFIRNRYIKQLKFLPSTLSPSVFQVESTTANRTQQSALHNFQGIFADDSLTLKDIGIKWHKVDEPNLIGYPYYNACAYAGKLEEYIGENEEYNKFMDTNPWYKKLAKSRSILHAFDFADPLYVEKKQNLSLAPNYEKNWDDILQGYVQSIRFFYGLDLHDEKVPIHERLVQYHAGRVLTELNDMFEAKKRCLLAANSLFDGENCDEIDDLKFKAYSLHDTYVMGSLFAMGFKHLDYNREENCEMASAIFWELWEDKTTNDFYVKVIYRRSANELFDVTKDIEGCEDDTKGCKLETFFEKIRPFEVTDPVEYCAQSIE